jgi:hypothetical protein
VPAQAAEKVQTRQVPIVAETAMTQTGLMVVQAQTSEKAAVVCDNFSSAQTVYALIKARRLGSSPPVKGCWLVDNGTEIVVIDTADRYSFIRIPDAHGSTAWTINEWLVPKT